MAARGRQAAAFALNPRLAVVIGISGQAATEAVTETRNQLSGKGAPGWTICKQDRIERDHRCGEKTLVCPIRFGRRYGVIETDAQGGERRDKHDVTAFPINSER